MYLYLFMTFSVEHVYMSLVESVLFKCVLLSIISVGSVAFGAVAI